MAKKGHGLMLLMVFLSTAVMTIVSLQMMQVNIGFGTNSMSSSHVTAYDLTMSAFALVREDILSKIDAGTFDPATYSYTGSISIPDDPTNLGGSSTPAGSFTATIPQYNGNTYRIQIVGTSGSATVQLSDILQIVPSPPSFDCTAVETAVFNGTLASVSNADLIAYAQNNCMIKKPTAPSSPAPTAASGSTNCTSGTASHSGSGTLNLNTISGGCEATISGSYSEARINSMSSGKITLTYDGAQTIEVGSMLNSLLNASTQTIGKIFRISSAQGGNTSGTSPPYSDGCITQSPSGANTVFNYSGCISSGYGMSGINGTCTDNATAKTLTCAPGNQGYLWAQNVSNVRMGQATYGGPANVSGTGCISSSVSMTTGIGTLTITSCTNPGMTLGNCHPQSIPANYTGTVNCYPGSSTTMSSWTGGSLYISPTPTPTTETLRGTSGNDTITLNGNCVTCNLNGRNGDDVIVVNGDTQGEALIYGDCNPSGGDASCSTAGNDKVYVRSLTEVSGNWGYVYGYDGDDQLYVDSSYGGEVRGGSGNDIIACTGVFGSGCSLWDLGAFAYGQGGNDIISIDTVLTNGSEITGNAGANIIYFKGLTQGTNGTTFVDANTSSGPLNQLVILAGNTNGGRIRAYGSNNVLLIKTGVTTGTTTLTGWARTLYY